MTIVIVVIVVLPPPLIVSESEVVCVSFVLQMVFVPHFVPFAIVGEEGVSIFWGVGYFCQA